MSFSSIIQKAKGRLPTLSLVPCRIERKLINLIILPQEGEKALLRNLYASQEATVRTRLGKTDWFQTGKGVCQGYILSPCFNLYAEYIIQNARLDEAQDGIKIAGRNV